MQELGLSEDEPPCGECLPDLYQENVLIYEVYLRMFNVIEHIDPFRIMKIVGIHKDDRLICLDMVNAARGEVIKIKRAKAKK